MKRINSSFRNVRAENQTRVCWVWSAYATSVLCGSPKWSHSLLLVLLESWGHAMVLSKINIRQVARNNISSFFSFIKTTLDLNFQLSFSYRCQLKLNQFEFYLKPRFSIFQCFINSFKYQVIQIVIYAIQVYFSQLAASLTAVPPFLFQVYARQRQELIVQTQINEIFQSEWRHLLHFYSIARRWRWAGLKCISRR